ncbi:ParA family protein [Leptospira alexanderi]|uniref:CobQ/CobB/MinD/ParA nucleotide binding domain protein n=3 Tax=Leptospira TaxID=171 RepID=V6HWX6_9LEPT|nr:AAA family ATPase [Leptospira alexanderi]EQA62430.1 CobQ/CobB/MinD/ParA nucleotide binding domain protein [Leptospira alexanderi serovar Manhao 3 str. L 60]
MPPQFVITITNPKGGTGKSTTAFHLTISISKNGKTLAADVDMQADFSDAFFPDTPIEDFDEANTFTVIRGETTLKNSVRSKHGIDVLVSSLEMEDFAYHATKNQSLIPKLGSILRNSNYDYVIIDTPGSGSSETISSIMAADYVLIPVKPSKWATRTIKRVLKKINEAQQFLNTIQSGRTIESFIVPVQWGKAKQPSARAIQILDQLQNYNEILSLLKKKEVGFDLVKCPMVTDPIPYIQEMDDRTENGEPFKPNTIGSEHYDRLVNTILNFHLNKSSKKDTQLSLTYDK